MSTPDRRSIPQASALAESWTSRRSLSADQIPDARACAEAKRTQRTTISVGIVAPDPATIDKLIAELASELMDEVALIDELIVVPVKAGESATFSTPGASQAREGVEVVAVADLAPEIPTTDGRGDALWRSLTVVHGDIVVWLDGDTDFDVGAVSRLVGPLLTDPTIALVRGYDGAVGEFEIEIGGTTYLAGGAPVNELITRPLLNILFPELGGLFRPFGGPSAGRTEVLRRIPFLSGCSVDVAMLIDVFEIAGLDSLAQVDVGSVVRDSRPLDELGPEAHAVARTILKRAEESKRIKLAPAARAHPLLVRSGMGVSPSRIDEVERPPIDVLPPYLAAIRSAGTNGRGPRANDRRTP